jgi:signal transduction histidine kinase
LNQHNPNDVELLLNVYPEGEIAPSVLDSLPILADYVASTAERILADRCTRATGAVQELFPRYKTKKEFLEKCLPVILNAVNGEAASLFLQDPTTNRLNLVATTGILWRSPDTSHFYERGQGRTGRVWSENVEFLSVGGFSQDSQACFSEEVCSHNPRSLLFVPIRDYSGMAIGVVRCRNRIARVPAGDATSFSQEDATVLQAVCDAMVPRLLLYEAEERVFQMFQKLTHELKMPLVGVNSQLDFIEEDAQRQQMTFRESWISEARESTNLMGSLLENAEVMIRELDPKFPPEPFSRVYLLRDIVAPVVDQMAAMLKRFGLSRNKIWRSNFESIPMLWVRANGVRQVVFNLLSNAIKYRFKDSRAFAVSILDEATPDHFLVHFQNWGPGIDASEEESIFEFGRRGAVATEYDVSGHGFGLAIARQIMREQGGEVAVTRRSLPTQFTLFFPRALVRKP